MADAQVKAIFNAGRRYCVDQLEELRSTIRSYRVARMPYEHEHKRAGESTRMLREILDQIELRVADDFRNVAEARAYLLGAGQSAKILDVNRTLKGGEVRVIRSERPRDPEEIAAHEAARAGYLDYVARITPR